MLVSAFSSKCLLLSLHEVCIGTYLGMIIIVEDEHKQGQPR